MGRFIEMIKSMSVKKLTFIGIGILSVLCVVFVVWVCVAVDKNQKSMEASNSTKAASKVSSTAADSAKPSKESTTAAEQSSEAQSETQTQAETMTQKASEKQSETQKEKETVAKQQVAENDAVNTRDTDNSDNTPANDSSDSQDSGNNNGAAGQVAPTPEPVAPAPEVPKKASGVTAENYDKDTGIIKNWVSGAWDRNTNIDEICAEAGYSKGTDSVKGYQSDFSYPYYYAYYDSSTDTTTVKYIK